MKMDTYYLDNWSVTEDNDPYKPPEMRGKQVQGTVVKMEVHTEKGKSRDWMGKHVLSGYIVSIKGRKVFTTNSIYVLGKIDPKYAKWSESEGYVQHLDEKEPIAWLKPAKRK